MTAYSDNLFRGQKLGKLIHILLFELHGWVYITVHGDVYIGMSENLAEAFDIKSQLDTAGGECMSENMKMDVLNIAGINSCLEVIFQTPGLDIGVCRSGSVSIFV